jgi:hypothetical protein
MDPFSYLSVLISIVLALGMTRVLAGVGEMLQARGRRRLYWVHVVWTLNLFLFLIVAWWIFYRWRDHEHWSFYLFLFVLVSPTILYLASLVLFPSESAPGQLVDYKRHYYANHRAFFILFALYAPIDVLDSLLKGVPHFLSLGPEYFISTGLFLAGVTIAAITRNERYHQIYALWFLCQTITVSYSIFRTLL